MDLDLEHHGKIQLHFLFESAIQVGWIGHCSIVCIKQYAEKEAEEKPKAKSPVRQGRVEVRKREGKKERGSERQKGGQHWEKT